MVVLLNQCRVYVGDTDRPPITAREMNEIIAGHGREQVEDFIQTTSEILGRAPNIRVAADKLSDLGQK
jgi:hypothetical protein